MYGLQEPLTGMCDLWLHLRCTLGRNDTAFMLGSLAACREGKVGLYLSVNISDKLAKVFTKSVSGVIQVISIFVCACRGNIPGSDVSRGEKLVDYIQPFPVRGTGAHRFVFVLFEQNKNIDYGYIKRPSPW